MEPLIKCPWCAEEILAEAKKCKHCGEFLTDDRPQQVQAAQSTASATEPWIRCDECGEGFDSNRGLYLHQSNVHGSYETRTSPKDAQAASYTGAVGRREKLSKVGTVGSAGLACPKCGSAQFKAKRSMKGKLAAGLLAPKTQVKCVACGTMYKRG